MGHFTFWVAETKDWEQTA